MVIFQTDYCFAKNKYNDYKNNDDEVFHFNISAHLLGLKSITGDAD